MRLPVAWKTALAMAAATPTRPTSPSPLAPSGLTTSSRSSTKITSMSWTAVTAAPRARRLRRSSPALDLLGVAMGVSERDRRYVARAEPPDGVQVARSEGSFVFDHHGKKYI